MSNRRTSLATPVANDGAVNAGSTVIQVGASAVQVLTKNDTRRIAYINSNTGSSTTVYLDTTNSVDIGVTQHVYEIESGGDFTVENYAGDLFAVGSSGYFAYVGVFEPYE